MDNSDTTEKKTKIQFRNYKPYDPSLQKLAVKVEISSLPISKSLAEDTNSSNLLPLADPILVELDEIRSKNGVNELHVVPKKANWDLKRHAEFKLEKLRKRTQRAIVEILREKLNAESGDGVDEDSDID